MRALRACATAANNALRVLQKTDGHWCAELQGDSILQSEYLLMKWILSQENAPMGDGRPADTLLKLVRQLRNQQRPDGGWGAISWFGCGCQRHGEGLLLPEIAWRFARRPAHEEGTGFGAIYGRRGALQ